MVLKQIQDHRPDLAAFSVTMPQYLVQCQEMVDRLKACYPDLKIAVGGNAFQSLSKIQGELEDRCICPGCKGTCAWADDTICRMRYDWLFLHYVICTGRLRK